MDTIKMDRILTNNTTWPFYVVFQVLKECFIEICKIGLIFNLSLFLASADIIFHMISRTSFNIIYKKDFHHEFSLFMDSLKPLPP